MDQELKYRGRSNLITINYTFSLIVLAIKDKAIPENIEMIPFTYLFASSLQSSSRLLKGESQTIQAI
jgi:hypothetical protein